MDFKPALILDLDFTLLHLEFVPDAIEVPGRTRSAWISPLTVEVLRALQEKFSLILATARSWDGTRWVFEGLQERGVGVVAAVIEDGALFGIPEEFQRYDAEFDGRALAEFLANTTPIFEWQQDFHACLVARCEDRENAAQLVKNWREKLTDSSFENWRLMRDGRKVYVLPRQADKWSALQKLLGHNERVLVGVGDGENDLCWLPQVTLPCTFARAIPTLVEAVEMKGGFITAKDGHEGIVDILRHVNMVSEKLTQNRPLGV